VNRLFPQIEFTVDETALPEKKMGKVFLFDFDERKFVLKDGKPVEANYEEAIKQWVSMVMITEKNKYGVYKGSDFGLSIAQFIGRKDIPLATISSETKRQIEEQLIQHPEILGISDFSMTRQDGKALISFSVQTKQGLITGIEKAVRFSG
jgi:Protein of unknown function (DUF2634)